MPPGSFSSTGSHASFFSTITWCQIIPEASVLSTKDSTEEQLPPSLLLLSNASASWGWVNNSRASGLPKKRNASGRQLQERHSKPGRTFSYAPPLSLEEDALTASQIHRHKPSSLGHSMCPLWRKLSPLLPASSRTRQARVPVMCGSCLTCPICLCRMTLQSRTTGC